LKPIYNIGIRTYSAGVKLAAIFGNKKAQKWVQGRKNWLSTIRNEVDSTNKNIWIHATSLGEFEQVKPLIEKIKADSSFSDYKIVVTFFSPSGFEYSKNYAFADYKYYLPIDSKSNALNFIDAINPSLAIFVKYDFWFNYLQELQSREIPHLFFGCNFRENQIYFKPGNKWQVAILKKINWLFTLTKESNNVLSSKGFINNKVCGDTRFDKVLQNALRCQAEPLIELFKGDFKLLILGSSWEKEEEILYSYLNANPDWKKTIKIIVAPHNIYGDHVSNIQENLPEESLLFSEANESNILNSNILIINNIGMLSNLYQYGDISFIGGGFTNRLHNILEAATFGNAILFGDNHSKFPEGQQLIDAGGGFEIKDNVDFSNRLNQFLAKEELLKTTKLNAKDFIQKNKGATEIVYQEVKEFLK